MRVRQLPPVRPMKITLHAITLVCLACQGLIPARAQSFPRIERESSIPRELISEGLGVRGVYLWRSNADDVAAVYGKDFELVGHGPRTVEMRYAARDLSFFYCQADPHKRIIGIECRAPFNGFTARGIVLGKSTVRDVFKAYGEAEPAAGVGGRRTFSYPGIEFSTPSKGGDRKPVSALLGAKITAINVTTPRGGSDCLAPDSK